MLLIDDKANEKIKIIIFIAPWVIYPDRLAHPFLIFNSLYKKENIYNTFKINLNSKVININ